MTALREVRLYGDLAKQFGKVFHLRVASAAEAARALAAQLPGFRRAFVGPDGQRRYHLLVGDGFEVVGQDRTEEPLASAAPIRFVPYVAGAKRQGSGQTILGAVLFIAGWVINAFTMMTGGNQLILMGLSMMAGGISQMMAAQRKPGQATVENMPSYGMDSGAVNTVHAGGPVPLAFGRVVIGSVQTSGGLSLDQAGSAGLGGGGGDAGGSGDGWGMGGGGGSLVLPEWEERDPFEYGMWDPA